MNSRSRVIGLAAASLLALLLAAGPAAAQIDLSGNWALQNQQDFQDSHVGNFPADFLGVPVNEEGRAGGLAWDGSILEELHRQCEPWGLQYLVQYGGPPARAVPGGGAASGFRIYASNDPVTGKVDAWHLSGSSDRNPITIWVDGRAPPPPLALHTFGGFTTGSWRGDTLVGTTTHLKDGFLTRNGVPISNRATITLFLSRHRDVLTITLIVHDPVYLSAPFPMTQTYKLNPAATTDIPTMTCDPAETVPVLSDGYHSVRMLPGTTTVTYMQEHYHIPPAAALGGAETMYPEFRKKILSQYTIPEKYCDQYCCGAMGTVNESTNATGRFDRNVLQCSADGY
jgi:hypothetical protein